MGFKRYISKMFVSVAFDVLDFFMPPVAGTIYDLAGGVLGTIMWGKYGAMQFLELIDITDRIDAFVPMLTIAGLLSYKEIFE